MNQITLKNFRCFREEQTARLAPLTLLVGENSTGKTSFLAMIRALWDVAFAQHDPDFKEAPYDLGSFDDIAYYRAGKGGRATTFDAGFSINPASIRRKNRRAVNGHTYHFDVTFKKKGTVPAPVKMRLARNDVWSEIQVGAKALKAEFGTARGAWGIPTMLSGPAVIDAHVIFIISFAVFNKAFGDQEGEAKPIILQGSDLPTDEDLEQLRKLAEGFRHRDWDYYGERPYASAPVRSKPHRTYDPARTTRDPGGDHIPMFLASMYLQDKEQWATFKAALENFGQESGLFDEITVKPLGEREGGPFQVHIKKYGSKGRLKGPQRNLIDVGYGVSQALPIITELLRPDASPAFLLQQPEVHLHPSAQAALGSLFCRIAPQRQLIVETHSDHLLDRVRMDIRDGTTPLKPEDVSILFFDRGDLDVTIHSLRIDEEGNILNAPPNYRKFFLEETRRSLGF